MARYSYLSTIVLVVFVAVTKAFSPILPMVTSQVHQMESSSSALNVKIKVVLGDGEPIESAIRRFKREVNKSGHLMELRHKRYFENSQERQKRKVKEARMRVKFERMQRRRMANRV